MIRNINTLNYQLSSLPKESFVVGFFIHNVTTSQDEWLNPLAAFLREKGFITVGIKTPFSEDKCNLGSAEIQAVIDLKNMPDIEGIHVFIISDMDCSTRFPEKSKILGCIHSFAASIADASIPHSTYCGSTLDGWMVPFKIEKNKKDIVDLWGGLLNIEASQRKDTTFHIIPTGYPRMHILFEKVNKLEQIPDTVVYAPIDIDFNKDFGGNRIQTYGKRLIRTILDNFPNLKVAFRPYKTNLDFPEVKEICTTFANEPRFIFDKSSERAFSFARGIILITDFSHVAQSFTFSTLRGAIYFQPWVKNGKKHTEWQGLYAAYNYTELVHTIKDMIEQSDKWAEKILAHRNATVVPFENSFEEIAGWLKDFYHGKSRPEWLEIQRCQPSNLFGLKELVSKITSQPTSAQPVLSASIYAFTIPDNPFVLAFGLHLGKSYQPNNFIYWRFHAERTFAQCLNKQLTAQTYQEIDPEDIRRLYSMGILEMLKTGDHKDAKLAQSLLDDFNKHFSTE